MSSLKIKSSAFEEGATIPSKYTCDGENLSPPLSIEGVPDEARSLAIIMEDPDVPKGIREDQLFVHWVLYNLNPSLDVIKEGGVPGAVGPNTRGGSSYTGPCPPPEYEPAEHRYIFKVFALDIEGLEEGLSREELLERMEGHLIASAELVGRYRRK